MWHINGGCKDKFPLGWLDFCITSTDQCSDHHFYSWYFHQRKRTTSEFTKETHDVLFLLRCGFCFYLMSQRRDGVWLRCLRSVYGPDTHLMRWKSVIRALWQLEQTTWSELRKIPGASKQTKKTCFSSLPLQQTSSSRRACFMSGQTSSTVTL